MTFKNSHFSLKYYYFIFSRGYKGLMYTLVI